MIIKLLNVELERETNTGAFNVDYFAIILMIKCVTEILTQLLATYT